MFRALWRGLTEIWSSECQSQCNVQSTYLFPSENAETQNIKCNKKVITKMILDFYSIFLQLGPVNLWTSKKTVSSLAYDTNEFVFAVSDNFYLHIVIDIYTFTHFYEDDTIKGVNLIQNCCQPSKQTYSVLISHLESKRTSINIRCSFSHVMFFKCT